MMGKTTCVIYPRPLDSQDPVRTPSEEVQWQRAILHACDRAARREYSFRPHLSAVQRAMRNRLFARPHLYLVGGAATSEQPADLELRRRERAAAWQQRMLHEGS
jgi:hypothetical protein